MKLLITGAGGFVGKNLAASLRNIRDGKDKTSPLSPELTIFEYDLDTDPALLDDYCRQADFVFHLAGVNRPKDPGEFYAGNSGLTDLLLADLDKENARRGKKGLPPLSYGKYVQLFGR